MIEFAFGDEVIGEFGRAIVLDERSIPASGVGVQPEMQFSKWGGYLAGNAETGVGVSAEMDTLPWDASQIKQPVFVRVPNEPAPRWVCGTELKLVDS